MTDPSISTSEPPHTAFDPANPGGPTQPGEHPSDPPAFDAVPDDAGAFAADGEHTGVSDLSAFDDEYEDAQVPSRDEVPDGKYQVRVHRVELSTSQAGDPMLKWDLVVISGQHAGRHIFKNAVITHKSLPFVKGDLHTLGVQLPRFSELPNHLDALLDQTLEVTKRTKGEYTNVYFNRRLEGLGAAGYDGLPSDEPAPF
ncbi:MAG: DUF669 domain-containing protein [Phycisphaeraceae bacterium]|nr:DUF669 domain-containing protein [Phycisphaeraceae bacterium]